jgi:hypothetical protein
MVIAELWLGIAKVRDHLKPPETAEKLLIQWIF